MPATIDDLATQFKENTDQLDAILRAAEGEGRGLTDEESQRYDELEKTADGLQAEIKKGDAETGRRNRQQARRDYLNSPRERLTTPGQPGSEIPDPQDLDADDRERIRRQLHMAGKLRCFADPDLSPKENKRNAHLCGQWLAATLFGNPGALRWCKEHGVESLTMGETSNPKGGVLVPPEFEMSLIKLREEYGVARQICFVTPMASDTKIKPRRTSGLTAYAIGENAEITASDAGYDNIQLTARKWGTLSKHSSELEEDGAISIADELIDEAAYAFTSAEDGCLFLGDGTSTYHGITGLINAIAAGSQNEAATGNLQFATLDLTDFEKMCGMLPEYPGINPVWLISKAGYWNSMARLIDSAGGNTSAQIEAGPGGRQFLGYPVVVSQKMNSTLTDQASTDGLCYFGDYRMGCTFGDRRGVRVKISTDRYLEYDQIGILSTERMDINVHGRGSASAAGPIIMLTTPSA